MTSIEFIDKLIKGTERSYKLSNNKRDADKLMKKLIHLRQVKKELMNYGTLKIDYQISLAFQEGQKEEMHELRKKFALHFKKDIQEGLKRDYRRGENIVYDSLLDEFGESFLKELNEVLDNEN